MLLERSEQLGVLRDALAEVVRRSCGAIAQVCGEAGIGKTALVREFCGEAGRQVRVLWAACDPLFTPRPLGPLADLAGSPGVGSGALVHDGARPFDVAVGLLRELRSADPTVLVLEDVHWADEATFDVISLLARRLRHVPALLVLSYRDDQLGRSHPLRIVLGDLPADVIRARIELDGLSPDAVRVLAEPAGVDPQRLHGRPAGNPFFVTEALAGGSERIPATVRDAVLARTARLGQHALAVLDVVAVVPGRAELWLVEALAIDAQSGLDDYLVPAASQAVEWVLS